MVSNRFACIAALAAAALAGCSGARPQHYAVNIDTPCSSRAVQIIAHNVDSIAAHRYAAASQAAERAARVSLACAKNESPTARFNDRWRGANALVVAAELAHQANDQGRAKHLVHEGYGIMHALRPPAHVSELTWTLISQTRSGAERDLRGHWSYW